MAVFKALRRLASGGFGLIAATDQIACDAGAMTVTETGASVSASVPDLFKAKANASDLLGIASDTAGLFSDLSEGAGLDLRMSSTTLSSQATVDLGTVTTMRVAITGTASISSFGTQPNIARQVTFLGACTLVHNATSLILPGAANIVAAAGDTAWTFSDGSGNVRVVGYQRANGQPLVAPQIVNGNAGPTSVPGGATRFFTHALMGASSQSEAWVQVPRKGRFRNLRVVTPGAPGAGQSWTFTLQNLFSDTALTCAVAGDATNEAFDLTNVVPFEAGARYCMKLVASSGAPARSGFLFAMTYEFTD